MKFTKLINNAVFQYLEEDEEKNQDKVLSLKQFEKWFKYHESDLIWNEQAQGYDSNTNINISGLNLSIIPIQFNIVKGDFDCSYNKLKSLKGCPKKVGGGFYCEYNKLTSLKGCPEIEKSFDCSNNQLISLEECPEKVGESFYCAYNKLTSLKGCPEEIKGNFNCSNNYLTSLKECPKIIKKRFNCSNNNLDINEFVRINCKKFICDKYYEQSETYKYWIKNKFKFI